jgi:hypothetical protein
MAAQKKPQPKKRFLIKRISQDYPTSSSSAFSPVSVYPHFSPHETNYTHNYYCHTDKNPFIGCHDLPAVIMRVRKHMNTRVPRTER